MKRTTKKTPRAEKPLTLQEEAFIGAYISNGGNAAAAVRTAGYKCKAKGAADVQGVRLLRRAKVSAEIARIRAELRRSTDVSAQEVIQTLASHLRGDVTELMGGRGSFDLKRIREAGLGRLIKKVSLKRVPAQKATNRRKAIPAYVFVEKLELYSAQSAANQLCKVLGIEQQAGKNRNDPEYLKKLLDERVAFAIEGFRRIGVSSGMKNPELSRREVLELFSQTPESAGDLYPLIQAELASEAIQ